VPKILVQNYHFVMFGVKSEGEGGLGTGIDGGNGAGENRRALPKPGTNVGANLYTMADSNRPYLGRYKLQ
jgi:hypothetical protein